MTILATEESRQYAGTLTFGTEPTAEIPNPDIEATPFEKQVFECSLEPAVEEKGDELTMLNGNVLGADESIKWTLKIGAVQDFMDPQGFLEFCRNNALVTVPFEWEPNSSLDSPTISGKVKIRPGKYGGATKLRLTSEIEFPVIGEPDVVHPA